MDRPKLIGVDPIEGIRDVKFQEPQPCHALPCLAPKEQNCHSGSGRQTSMLARGRCSGWYSVGLNGE